MLNLRWMHCRGKALLGFDAGNMEWQKADLRVAHTHACASSRA